MNNGSFTLFLPSGRLRLYGRSGAMCLEVTQDIIPSETGVRGRLVYP